MKLRLTGPALRQLNAISAYLRDVNPRAAASVGRAIEATFDTLIMFPAAGRLQSVPGVRKLATRKYGYLIYYRVDQKQDQIVVLSIQHGSRQRSMRDV